MNHENVLLLVTIMSNVIMADILTNIQSLLSAKRILCSWG